MISPTSFQFIKNLVLAKAGIVVAEGKEYLVEDRMLTLLKKLRINDIDELVWLSQLSQDHSIDRQIIEAMTTNETSFFRDVRPFELLKKRILPEYLSQPSLGRTLNIWSAACSSGQEAYSIAMSIREYFPLSDWKIRILATDISTDVLNQARGGRYSQLEINRGLPMPMLLKYFEKEGEDWLVKEELRSMVEFRELNFKDPWPSLPDMDIVFLRNVMIYFDMETKKKILTGMHRLLKPKGTLLLGGAETTLNLDAPYDRVEAEGYTYFVPVEKMAWNADYLIANQ